MNGGRLAVFLSVVLSIWAAIHAYVFWRISDAPWVAAHVSRRTLFIAGALLWASFVLARSLNAWHLPTLGRPLLFVASQWVGILFILFSVLLAADVLTLGGRLFPHAAGQIRGWAVAAGLGLSVLALVQGSRDPVVSDFEVTLDGLPPERDGLTVVAMTDLHLDALTSEARVARLVAQVNALRPDAVVAVGDIVDGDPEGLGALAASLRQLRAPLGTWAVTGNHEFYVGFELSERFLKDAGFTMLHDQWALAAPGFVIAGVDDLGARRFAGSGVHPTTKALANRPPGAAILLCHTPVDADVAAAAGAGLMLCGHTHNGQIWPFNYLVKMRFPMIVGRYEVNGMTVIVSRGAGTWGPRMRLWQPGEILRIKLRAKPASK